MFNNRKIVKGLCVFLAVLMAGGGVVFLLNVIL